VLYLHNSSCEASPKAISGRTSYLRVRLAFHPYPQLIPRFFNTGGFGPPRTVTYASPWPRVDHSASGLRHATLRPLQTRFRCGSGPLNLNLATYRNSPVHSAIGTQSSHYCSPTVCRHTVSGSLSLPSRGAFHLSLTVLVHYRSLRVFSLGRWSSRIPTGFPVPRGTWDPDLESITFRLRDFYPLWWRFPALFG
jgi:hypothetical protein